MDSYFLKLWQNHGEAEGKVAGARLFLGRHPRAQSDLEADLQRELDLARGGDRL